MRYAAPEASLALRDLSGMPALRTAALLALVASGAALCGCRPASKALVSRGQTFAELRTIKRGVRVQGAGEAERDPYPRERLTDGERVTLRAGGLAWLRRDGGATLLVSGPAKIEMGAGSVRVDEGRVFVDTLSGLSADITTPKGVLHLSDVRASLEVKAGGVVSAYVLKGAIRTEAGVQAGPGENLEIGEGGKATRTPAISWDDWTGGLATTDQSSQPAPFGIGTVGARTPGAQGQPRFPLAIQKLEVRVKIDHDFALTEVEEVFFNPSGETVEGIYSFRTPPGATLHRFGVDRDGQLVWGRVKEKAAAAAQYQSNVFVGSTEDPALLEWSAPGVYQARLYPIAPGGSRRVVTRYAEWLGRQGPKGERRLYVYPMAAEGPESTLPHIEELTIVLDLERAAAREVRVGMAGEREGQKITARAWDVLPRADFAAELLDDGSPVTTAYRAPHTVELDTVEIDKRERATLDAQGEQDYVLIPIKPTQANEPEGGLDLAVVIDTSAATDASALAVARATTSALLAHLGKDDRAAVWAGDATLRPVAVGSGDFAATDGPRRAAIAAGLSRVERGGATDLGAIVAEAASRLDPKRRGAVIYVGDGQPTVGELGVPELRERLARLPRPVRLFALGVGTEANMGILKGIARGGFAEQVPDAYAAGRTALHLLEEAERPVWLGAQIDLGTGVERVYPRELGALAADESALVVGRVVGETPKSIVIKGSGGQVTQQLVTMPLTDDGDMRRRWAEGRLVQLLDEGAGRAAVVEVGARYGVITPFTSLYVPTTREIASEQNKEQDERRARARRERLEEDKPAEEAPTSADNKEGGTGTRAKGEEGSMGNPNTRSSNNRYAVKGPADNPDPHLSRQAALRDAAEFGSIGLLNDPNAPSAPWGRDDSTGKDQVSARGNMYGASIGDAFGAGGLGLSGIGEGGGGRGEGIGLGSIGSLGHGSGTSSGQGFGSGHGRLGGDHKASAPQVRMGATTISGRLPPEVVQRIVRQNFGRFRLCYENGLRNNPNLQGRVSVRFVIDRSGATANVGNGGSDLPDSSVVNCIVRSFTGLSFPQPEGGIVTVTYPISFAPGGGSAPASKSGSDDEQSLKPGAVAAAFVRTSVLGQVGHSRAACGSGSELPFDERITLWRERLGKAGGHPPLVAGVYYQALSLCEAPSWRERTTLLSMMVDSVPAVKNRVALWRQMFNDSGAADALYRSILTRVRTAQHLRELHDALGLKHPDPGLVTKALKEAKGGAPGRVKVLLDLIEKWPDDDELKLKLLDAHEDAGDVGSGRHLARQLRRKNDASARVRTAVGEYYLRLGRSPAGAPPTEAALADVAEARRTFGEIVEFAPDDPVGRRRLGDLLRAHGWNDEASRQYATLARLLPDDTTLPLLLAAAAQGTGKTEEAIRWTEKAAQANAPDGASGTGRVARAFAAAFLAWARDDAQKGGRADEADQLRERARRLTSVDGPGAGSMRVILTWSHPELHPVLWSNALGAPMPAPDVDPLLGIAQVSLPSGKSDAAVEIRLEVDDAERAARLGAEAQITVLVREGQPDEKILRLPVTFTRAGAVLRRFKIAETAVTEET
jgi:tetratricopeptide (TPR) repeat protein